jgi:hypothetical protein
MAQIIDCPSCHVRLRLPASSKASSFSCPRCLAAVSNPEPPSTGNSAAVPKATENTSDSVYQIRSEPAVSETNKSKCPGCGKLRKPEWMICPHCGELFGGQGRSFVDREIRRDVQQTTGAFIGLAVLGGFALVLTMFSGITSIVQRDWRTTLGAVGSIVFLLGLSSVIIIVRSKGDMRALNFGRVVTGSLALAGAFIVGWLMIAVCVFVFFFAACLGRC